MAARSLRWWCQARPATARWPWPRPCAWRWSGCGWPPPIPLAAGGVTISIGVAHVAQIASADPAALLAATDAALYEAKRAGRNRVVEGRLPEAHAQR
nr:diguanylate cyclase [Stenotrophomonas rhizophila]